MSYGKEKSFNIRCKSKGCTTLTNKLCQADNFEDVVILLCDVHRTKSAFATLPYLIEQDGEFQAKCFSCGNVWKPQTFKKRKYNRAYKQYGDVPQTCAKCRSHYWKAPHNAVMRGWH